MNGIIYDPRKREEFEGLMTSLKLNLDAVKQARLREAPMETIDYQIDNAIRTFDNMKDLCGGCALLERQAD